MQIIETSPELRAVMKRWVEAVQAKQLDTIGNLFSGSGGALYIGSDPDEWWVGSEFATVLRSHVEEMVGVDFALEIAEAEAHQAERWVGARSGCGCTSRAGRRSRFA